MSAYAKLKQQLQRSPRTWLVTGVAGFIGSNLLEQLLNLNQPVVGLDNFSTGYRRNLDVVRSRVGSARWRRFRLVTGDVGELAVCRRACAGAQLVLHQAALASVPGSLADPVACHQANVTGFVNLLQAAREAKVQRIVYASSSAVYGDKAPLPNVEDKTSPVLSPYAATKAMDEAYAQVFRRAYGADAIGLRYFNVFGPRQDPAGAYAAVIPAWIAALLQREPIYINGDGKTTRDFCYIGDVVQANLLAALAPKPAAAGQVYNVASGKRTTLLQLFDTIQAVLPQGSAAAKAKPVFRDFRPGDIRHSVANITKARRLLGYSPEYTLRDGLGEALQWYLQSSNVSVSPRL